MSVLEQLIAARVIAIVRLERYTHAVEVARALYDGGMTAVEFTLTGQGVDDAVRRVRAALGNQMLVGVGTVLDARAADLAIDSGAQFLVTPTVRTAVIAVGRARGVPVACGALTPTEALTAHESGADLVKIFPVRAFGPQYIRDLLAPLPFLRLVPTGGIGAEHARAYLEAGAVAVGVGGNLVSAQAVAQQDWAAITAQARAIMQQVVVR